MEILNAYEMALLTAAIEEENNTGARMHDYPKQEAAQLYELAQKGSKIAFLALKDVLAWWSVYFSCGYEVANKIKQQKIDGTLNALSSLYEERRDGTELLH